MARVRESGVYVIKNEVTGQEYVGSSVDLDHRKYCHFRPSL